MDRAEDHRLACCKVPMVHRTNPENVGRAGLSMEDLMVLRNYRRQAEQSEAEACTHFHHWADQNCCNAYFEEIYSSGPGVAHSFPEVGYNCPQHRYLGEDRSCHSGLEVVRRYR